MKLATIFGKPGTPAQKPDHATILQARRAQNAATVANNPLLQPKIGTQAVKAAGTTEVSSLLGHNHLSRVINDPNFYALLPEFSPMRARAKALQVDMESKRGCSSCKKRKMADNIFAEFARTVLLLSPDRVATFKKHLGIDKLMINVLDPATKAVKLRVI